MCFLIVLGWIVAGVIWWQFGWVWGLIAVILFAVTGFGWKLLELGAASTWYFLSPSRRRFSKAWRDLGCDHARGLGPATFDVNFIEWATKYKGMGRTPEQYLGVWLSCTTEQYSSFYEAWHELAMDTRLGEDSFDHWLYQWLTAGGQSDQRDPREFITTVFFSVGMRRGL